MKTYKTIHPSANGSLYIGGSSLRWHQIHAETFVLGGTGSSTTTNGAIWLDGTSVKVRTGGSTKSLSDIGTGGSSSGISSLLNLTSRITFSKTTSSSLRPNSNEVGIGADTNDNLYLSAPSGNSVISRIGGVNKMLVDEDGVTISSLETVQNGKLGFFGGTAQTKYGFSISTTSSNSLSTVRGRVNLIINALKRYGLIS